MEQPLKFLPYFRNTMWGGKEIPRFKQLSVNCPNIGESWELSAVPGCESIVAEGEDMGQTLSDLTAKYGEQLVGRRVFERYGGQFPLSIRLIDVREDLSLHELHNTAYASEQSDNMDMWYILKASDGAMIHTQNDYEIDGYVVNINGQSVSCGNGYLQTQPGDALYMPARYVKTIGAGHFLMEIQQACNAPTANLNDIKVNYEDVIGSRVFSNPDDALMTLLCLKGAGKLKIANVMTTVQQGETILIPAATESFEIEGDLSLLKVAI